MTAFPKYPKYKDSGVEWLGDVPEHWEVNALRACAALNVERNRPDLPVLSVYREYGVILKDSRDDNHNATSLDTSNYKVVHPGDLAVNKMKAWQGSLGVSEHHGIVSPAYITCKVNQSKVAGRYLHYLLRSKPLIGALDAISYGVRVGQWDMRFEDFKQVSLTYPPLAEQDRIVAFLDEKTAEIDRLIAKKQRQIDLLDEQKAILINRAVTRGLHPQAELQDSGIPWIGPIPKGWEVKRVRHAFRVIDCKHLTVPFTETGFDLISIGELDGMVVSVANSKKTDVKHFSVLSDGERKLQAGDIIFSRNASVGKCSIVREPTGCAMGQDVCLLRPLMLNPEFGVRFLRSPAFQKQIAELLVGSTFNRINISELKELYVLHPGAIEVPKLLEFLTDIDAKASVLHSKLESQIQTLQTLRSTLIAHAVTGKIKVI
jgi:type I restriction enzyme S subunit